MNYRIVKRRLQGEIMYVIVDDNGDEISEWEDKDDARQELFDLNEAVDVVDYMAGANFGDLSESGNDETVTEDETR